MLSKRKRTRLENHNYSHPGAYFVTICTESHIDYFGEVFKNGIHLSSLGKIAHKFWLEIPEHNNYIELDKFTVMPNHLHGIIIIQASMHVGNRHACSLQKRRQNQKLPSIIGSLKSAITREIRNTHPTENFAWQKSHHDRIIRSETELRKIRNYIAYNPANWENDPIFQGYFIAK